MPEEAVKQRLNRAVKAAIRCLEQPSGSHLVFLQSNGPFQIEAVREKEIRKIRVVIDGISKEDEKAVRNIKLPLICTKEIWCKLGKEKRGFTKKEIR